MLRELGIGVTAYGVLSRGLLSGSLPPGRRISAPTCPVFRRRTCNATSNSCRRSQTVAASKSTTPVALAIDYVMAKGGNIIPVMGARKTSQLANCLEALQVRLTPRDIEALESAVPAEAVAGDRYDAHQVRILDSER